MNFVFRLEWDMKTMSVNNAPGVLTRTPGFGGTSSIETLDSHGLVKYMKPFVDDMVANGYTRGTDIRGAPYDFRYSPGEFIKNGVRIKEFELFKYKISNRMVFLRCIIF